MSCTRCSTMADSSGRNSAARCSRKEDASGRNRGRRLCLARLGTSRPVQQCSTMFNNVQQCSTMSNNVQQCPTKRISWLQQPYRIPRGVWQWEIAKTRRSEAAKRRQFPSPGFGEVARLFLDLCRDFALSSFRDNPRTVSDSQHGLRAGLATATRLVPRAACLPVRGQHWRTSRQWHPAPGGARVGWRWWVCARSRSLVPPYEHYRVTLSSRALPAPRRSWRRCPARCGPWIQRGPQTGCTADRRRARSFPRTSGRRPACRNGWPLPSR